MRVQLALNVSNLEESIDFYEKMFATEVAKVRPGYANFAIENPPLKLVLFEASEAQGGTLNHLGVEVMSADEVEAAERRMVADGVQTTGVDDTLCCYAAKTETWVEGPDTKWEWYVKTADTEQMENIVVADDGNTCCSPASDSAEAGATTAACC